MVKRWSVKWSNGVLSNGQKAVCQMVKRRSAAGGIRSLARRGGREGGGGRERGGVGEKEAGWERERRGGMIGVDWIAGLPATAAVQARRLPVSGWEE